MEHKTSKYLERFKTNGANSNNILTIYLRKMKWLTKLIEKVGIDKITHFFVGATISLSVTLILCFVGSISNVVPYSIIGTNVAVFCGVAKELLDTEFSIEDFLATMFGGIIAIIISLFSIL